MAIARRAAEFDVGGNSTVANINIPATVQVGDLMVLEWSTALNTAGWTDPAGWTLRASGLSASSNFGIRLFTRVAESGDAGSTVTCTLPGASRQHVNVVAYYDDAGGAQVAYDAVSITDAVSTFTIPPLVATGACVAVSGAGVRNTGVETWTTPAPWTEVGEGTTSNGTGGKAAVFAERLTPVSAGTDLGGAAFTPSAGTQGVAWVMTLKLPSTGPAEANTAVSSLTITAVALSPGGVGAVNLTPAAVAASAGALSVPGPYDDLVAAMAGGAVGYVSHRGGATLHPQNTLYAFQQSINNTLILETDVYQLSATGAIGEARLALSHDSDLTQVPMYQSDGVTPVGSSPDLTATSRASFTSYLVPQPGGGTMRAATMWDSLADYVTANRRVVMPESKHTAAVQPLIDSIVARGLRRHVITQSFTYSHCTTFAAAGLPTLWLTTSFATNSAAAVKAAGIDHVGWQAGTADFPAFVAAAHGAGLKVWVYTVNTRSSANAYIADGADGILTNRPDLVRGGSVVELTPGGAGLTATPVAPVPQSVAVTLTPASVALSGSQVAPVAQPGAVSLAPAVVATTAPAVAPIPQPVTVSLTQAASTVTSIAVSPVPQPVTVSLAPATVAVTGRLLTATPGAVTVTLSPAAVAVAVGSVSPAGGPSIVSLSPASVAASGRPLTAVPGVVTVSLSPAGVTAAASSVSPQPMAVSVALTPASVTVTAVSVSPASQSGTVTLTAVALTLSALPLSPSPGVVGVTLVSASVTLTARPLSAGGPVGPVVPRILFAVLRDENYRARLR